VEIQPYSADLARRSVEYNKFADRITIVCGDIKKISEILGTNSFDAATCNPPYIKKGAGKAGFNGPKTTARHETQCALEDVINAAGRALRPRGRFYMVHKPERLADAVCLMREYGLEPKRARFAYPGADKPPAFFMIEGVKGSASSLKIMPPLIL
jgi:tRNA1Val (adenine37-N6)-methyltransferase